MNDAMKQWSIKSGFLIKTNPVCRANCTFQQCLQFDLIKSCKRVHAQCFRGGTHRNLLSFIQSNWATGTDSLSPLLASPLLSLLTARSRSVPVRHTRASRPRHKTHDRRAPSRRPWQHDARRVYDPRFIVARPPPHSRRANHVMMRLSPTSTITGPQSAYVHKTDVTAHTRGKIRSQFSPADICSISLKSLLILSSRLQRAFSTA